MEVEIRKENYNRLLKRREIEAYVAHPEAPTPSTETLKQLISSKTGKEADKTEIRQVLTLKGAAESECFAFVWDEKIPEKTVAKKKDEKNAKTTE